MENNNLGTIWAEIGIDYRGYDQAINHIVRQNSWIDAETQKAMNNISQHYSQMGKTMSVAITAPLTLLGRQWVNTFADFQQSMANTQSVIGATTQELELLTRAARTAGEETVFKASEAADALYYLAQAGMDTAQAIGALDGVLTLAVASQSDLAYTSEVVAASLSQFNLEAHESTRIANLFAAANAESLASLDKLAGAMKNAGPVAAGFGYTIEETTAALMGLLNAGFQGEQAGNILKRALSELANPTGDAINVINELKLSTEQLHPEMNSIADILDLLNESGITSTQSLRLFGQIAGPGMNQLLSQGGQAVRDFNESISGTEKAAEQAAIQLNTLQGDWKIMMSVYESLTIQMTENFEPALRQIVQQITEMLGWLRDLNPETQRFAVTIAGFAAAAGPTMIIVSQLIKALPILFGPTGWIYAGVAAATALGFAISASERDMQDFYQTSIDSSRATQDQADNLRRLLDEYKALEGKPDKSEQEHKRLQTVMEEIIAIQPTLAAGYDTIDEAMKANIGTIKTYIKTLETESELTLRLANLEYLRQRNQLESELLQLQKERKQLEEELDPQVEEAERIVNLKDQAELAFMSWQEAVELGLDELAGKHEKELHRILTEWAPDFVPENISGGPGGIYRWVKEIQDASKHANNELTKLKKQLDSTIAEINKKMDIQAHGQAVGEELERRSLGIPEEPPGPPVGSDDNVVGETEKTTDELEAALNDRLHLFRSHIELIRNEADAYADAFGDKFETVFGETFESLEQAYEKYIGELVEGIYDPQLSIPFRAALSNELQKFRDEIADDPDAGVYVAMQVYAAELSLLRSGIVAYEEELGGLQDHLSKYSQWLGEQLTDTGLKSVTHARIAEVRGTIEEELNSLLQQSEISVGEYWSQVLGLADNYGAMSGRLRNALYHGEIKIDWSSLDDTQERIQNFYQYLVQTGEITLDDQLGVVNYQIEQAVAGSNTWLNLWRDKLHIQEQIKRLNAEDVSVSTNNEALQKQVELLEQLKHANDDNANTYELQAEWLEKNILHAEGVLETEHERRDVENEIFSLRLSHYQELSQAEGWGIEEQISQLSRLVGEYASSFAQIRTVNQMQADLQKQLARQQEQDDDDKLRRAQEVSDKFLQLEIDRLRNLGEIKDAEILEEYARYQRELRAAGDDSRLQDIARQSYEERLKSLGIRDAEQVIRDAEETAYQAMQVDIKRLENLGQLEEADVQRAYLNLTKKLDQHKDNQERTSLAYEEYYLELDRIRNKYADRELEEQEKKLAEQRRLAEEWQAFLVLSGQTTQQSVLANEIKALEEEIALLEDGNERKYQLELELAQAKYELTKQELYDRRILLNTMVVEGEIDSKTQLDLLRKIRQDYEKTYGDNFRMSTEWQQVRQQELALEEQVHQELAKSKINEIKVNNQSIDSLLQKQQALLKLIDATESYTEKQEYLNELLETQNDIKTSQDQTLDFFTKVSPEVGSYTNQLLEMNQLIQQSPQAYDNMRVSMNQMFGDYGDGLAALYGALSGYAGAGGDIPGILAGISGAVAGVTGDPVFAMISSGISLVGQLFDPGPMPQDAQTLKDNIDKVNESLKEFGVAYQSAQLAIEKERFLGFLWQTGWEITGEEAAKQGYEIGQAMLESMNTSLSSLGSAMAQAISGQATWDDFQTALGQQLQRILMQEIMAAAEFEKQAKLIAGMMEEAVSGGYTQDEINRIKDAWREILDATKQEWDQYSVILDEMFPTEDTTVRHEVRGVQITRLAGQDRDMFAEWFRPLSVLDQLPGLFQPQMELFQEYQTGRIAQLHATQIFMENVYIERIERAEFHGNIESLNVNGEALDESLDKKMRAMTDEAISRTIGSGN